MPRANYAALQAKIEKEIGKLQKKAEALQAKRRKPMITSIIASMHEYAITPDEIAAVYDVKATHKVRGKSTKRAGTATGRTTKRPVAPKYRHPKPGETWSGRGKAPRWLAAEEAAGVPRESFFIHGNL
jgi:DNA-binding protein H-NS